MTNTDQRHDGEITKGCRIEVVLQYERKKKENARRERRSSGLVCFEERFNTLKLYEQVMAFSSKSTFYCLYHVEIEGALNHAGLSCYRGALIVLPRTPVDFPEMWKGKSWNSARFINSCSAIGSTTTVVW